MMTAAIAAAHTAATAVTAGRGHLPRRGGLPPRAVLSGPSPVGLSGPSPVGLSGPAPAGLSRSPAVDPGRPGPVPVPSLPTMSCRPAARPAVRIRSVCRGRAVVGSTSSKLLPAPGVLRTCTSPPWPTATARTRVSPSPVPRGPPRAGPVRNRSKMWSISAGMMPSPESSTTRRADLASSSCRTESLIVSPAPVCCTAFSSRASRASPRRSWSAGTVTASSPPVVQTRRAVGCQRRSASTRKLSSATGARQRNAGSWDAAISSRRSLRLFSRVSSPTIT